MLRKTAGLFFTLILVQAFAFAEANTENAGGKGAKQAISELDNMFKQEHVQDVYKGKQISRGSADKSVRKIIFNVYTEVEGGRDSLHTTKECPAVLIDENWMIASIKCQGVKTVASVYTGDTSERAKLTIKSRSLDNLRVQSNGKNYQVPFERVGNFILVNVGADNTLRTRFSVLPKADILAAKNPEKFYFEVASREDIKIKVAKNSEGGKALYRELNSKFYDGKYIKTESSVFNASAYLGYPLFIVLPNGREFLSAFNTGSANKMEDNTFSNRYEPISPEDYTALKDYLLKNDYEAWKRIEKKAVTPQTTAML